MNSDASHHRFPSRPFFLVALGLSWLGSLFVVPMLFAARTKPGLQGNSFEVTDQKGVVRARLGLSDEGAPGLWFFDPNGVERAAYFYNDKEQAPGLVLTSPEGHVRVELRLDRNQLPYLALRDGEGTNRVRASIDSDHAVSIDLFDKGGSNRGNFTVHSDNRTVLILRRRDEKPAVAVRVLPDGTPDLQLLDATNTPVFEAPPAD